MKTLIVEHDFAARVLLRQVLADYATQTDEAHTLHECLDLITGATYDVIVLDLKLPDSASPQDTLSALPAIKGKQQGALLVVSAHSGEGLKRASKELGADYFIEKSNPDELKAALLAAITAVAKTASGPNLQANVALLQKISKGDTQKIEIKSNP